ncbi:Uncharacterized protein dnm_011840 [Desulfonema magnum]|uniref:Uncharacterized protein n=1 Tax=Desulfonema magnum TaxID=45655 RepID=A0A975BH94_9BACT|nr:Uncharacterized protein dnm_011840 [Desulfonema magnum]
MYPKLRRSAAEFIPENLCPGTLHSQIRLRKLTSKYILLFSFFLHHFHPPRSLGNSLSGENLIIK